MQYRHTPGGPSVWQNSAGSRQKGMRHGIIQNTRAKHTPGCQVSGAGAPGLSLLVQHNTHVHSILVRAPGQDQAHTQHAASVPGQPAAWLLPRALQARSNQHHLVDRCPYKQPSLTAGCMQQRAGGLAQASGRRVQALPVPPPVPTTHRIAARCQLLWPATIWQSEPKLWRMLLHPAPHCPHDSQWQGPHSLQQQAAAAAAPAANMRARWMPSKTQECKQTNQRAQR